MSPEDDSGTRGRERRRRRSDLRLERPDRVAQDLGIDLRLLAEDEEVEDPDPDHEDAGGPIDRDERLVAEAVPEEVRQGHEKGEPGARSHEDAGDELGGQHRMPADRADSERRKNRDERDEGHRYGQW